MSAGCVEVVQPREEVGNGGCTARKSNEELDTGHPSTDVVLGREWVTTWFDDVMVMSYQNCISNNVLYTSSYTTRFGIHSDVIPNDVIMM